MSKFHIGQTVKRIKDVTVNPSCHRLITGNEYTVSGFHGSIPGFISIAGYEKAKDGTSSWYTETAFAPIERTRTKYVEKEVEVAESIKELQKCLS